MFYFISCNTETRYSSFFKRLTFYNWGTTHKILVNLPMVASWLSVVVANWPDTLCLFHCLFCHVLVILIVMVCQRTLSPNLRRLWKPNSSLGWRVLLASGKKIAQAVGGLGSRLQCELEIYANINSKSFSYLRNKVETPLLHHAIHCCSISCLKKIKPKKFWKGPKEYNNNNNNNKKIT